MPERSQVVQQTEDFGGLLQPLGFLGSWSIDYRSESIRLSSGLADVFALNPRQAARGFDLAVTAPLHHPDDLAWVEEERRRSPGPSGLKAYEYRVIDREGAVRWIGIRTRVKTDRYFAPICEEGITFDVTALKAEADTAGVTPHAPLQPAVNHFADGLITAMKAAQQLGLRAEQEQLRSLLMKAGRLLAKVARFEARALN